ncbi:Na+/H+ antiporter NhaC family protein, partial [Planococcus sp. SIMBA_143]
LMKDAFDEFGLERKNLSRTLEDAGTMVLPFIPWGTSGIYYTTLLDVTISEFMIWAIPCYLCVVFALIYGWTGFGIAKK